MTVGRWPRATTALISVLLALAACAPGGSSPRAHRHGPRPCACPAGQYAASGRVALRVRRATVSESTQRFGHRPEQFMRVFTPTRGHRHPAVLFVHGGAWTRAWALPNEVSFARRLAARTGWVVAVPGYNTSTSPGSRVQPRNVERALSTLRAGRHVNPARVALWGESAGGNLSMIVGYAHPDQVRAVVSVSGPTDMVYEYRNVTGVLRREIRHFEGGRPRARPAAYRVTSPVRHVRSTTPPTLLATSTHDKVVPPRQQHALYRMLRAAGVRCRLAVVAGSGHSSEIESKAVIGSTHTVRATAIAFLAGRLA